MGALQSLSPHKKAVLKGGWIERFFKESSLLQEIILIIPLPPYSQTPQPARAMPREVRSSEQFCLDTAEQSGHVIVLYFQN
ncbi:hypothetical protein RRG08_043672 [Elysia crispata]|uniref:Uncharacterized protein n=1 Tax=Elysia crispata TaxID=231223 RepID=A0AAE0ZV85_9GAST|nr:hypothetical protein RRG08_043672 [Elysia crispata]